MTSQSRESTQKIEIQSLYQEVILDHSKHPRFKENRPSCQYCVEGKNPLCGDQITLFCTLDNQKRLCVAFDGSGCSICQASASMMCEAVQGLDLQNAKALIQTAEDIYTGKTRPQGDDIENDLEALSGVSKFPVRIKCAALPWKTLQQLVTDNIEKQTNLIEKNTTPVKKLRVISTE